MTGRDGGEDERDGGRGRGRAVAHFWSLNGVVLMVWMA